MVQLRLCARLLCPNNPKGHVPFFHWLVQAQGARKLLSFAIKTSSYGLSPIPGRFSGNSSTLDVTPGYMRMILTLNSDLSTQGQRLYF